MEDPSSREEWQTPGGNRVVVEITTANHRLTSVHLSGDFSFRPESSYLPTRDAIAASLVGVSLDLPLPALAARIRAAIPFGVDLIGASPESIATALLHAIHRDAAMPPAVSESDPIGSFTSEQIAALTESWRPLAWRILPETPLSPLLNVALDEHLTDQVAAGAPPTLRFWRWTSPAVVIGRCQSVVNEVDREAAAAMGMQVVRRLTGGGAMFLQPHGAITYSLYLPEGLLAGLSIRQSYEVSDAWVIRGLRTLGIDAHHVPINDIACSDGKIGGAAQARRKGVVLHHTTLAYDMDPGEMARVLRIGRAKLREKAVASAARRVSPLSRQTGLSREQIVAHLQKGFIEQYGGTIRELTAEEIESAQRLVETKYGTSEWTQDFE